MFSSGSGGTGGDEPAFRSRRELLQILDSVAGLHDMCMLNIRPYLLSHFGGIRPLYPLRKAEVAVGTDLETMLRCGDTWTMDCWLCASVHASLTENSAKPAGALWGAWRWQWISGATIWVASNGFMRAQARRPGPGTSMGSMRRLSWLRL